MRDWETVKVGEIFEVQLGKMLNKKAKEGKQFSYLTNFNVQWGRFDFSRLNEMHFNEREKEKYHLKKNDILMCEGGAIGRCAIWQEEESKYFYQKALHRLRVLKVEKINPYYFCAYMEHICNGNELVKIVGETSIAHLTREKLLDLRLPCPPKRQQDEIASILQTWNTAIEKTEALIVAKEKRFGWIVNSLISANQYSDKWQKHYLGNIVDIYTYSSKSGTIVGEGCRLIVDMGSVSRTGDLIPKKQTKSNEDILQLDDLIMPKDDIGGGNIIGKVALIDSNDRYVCGDHVYRLIQKKNNNACFLRFVINSPAINKRLRACANGTSQLGLGKRDVEKQSVWLPSLSEQKRIASLLERGEKEIGILKQIAELYRTQKRGLMQKLLTGKWRVKG